MLSVCARGFANWTEKNAWSDANKAAKENLSEEDQARVREAWKKATPASRGAGSKGAAPQPEAVPHDPVTGEVLEREAGSDDGLEPLPSGQTL
jgi:hypothetical protein